ncbi:transcription factor E2FC-like [Coffea arabica]|uniref:Transcription factor E2FC-like n=1 Tax=Coffea arabica TaxID=13443 RepID=A0A6P6UVG8_COFAR
MSTSGDGRGRGRERHIDIDLNVSLNSSFGNLSLAASGVPPPPRLEPQHRFSVPVVPSRVCERLDPFASIHSPPAAADPSAIINYCIAPNFLDIQPKDSFTSRNSPSLLGLPDTNEHGIFEANKGTSKTSSVHDITQAVNAASLKLPVSLLEAKQCSKARGSNHVKPGTLEPNAEVLDNVGVVGSCRYDSSLGLLTKKFIKLIREAEDGCLDLNRAADLLEVQKRRIYDITNVLEGVGLIEKTTKSHIRWKGYEMFGPEELNNQASILKAEIERLFAEDCRLDDCIRKMDEKMNALVHAGTSQRTLYLTEEDIMSQPCFRNKTVIAVKAPHASTLEVPDPDEDIGFSERQYKLILRSTTGPIDLYLLSNHGGHHEDVKVKRRKLLDSSVVNGCRQGADDAYYSDASGLQSSDVSGINKIIPSDGAVNDDYWLRSDYAVTATDLWGTECS